jgi:hypothetical protein
MDVKNDMLTESSTVQEILRALYFYGTDYIMSIAGRRERLIHKEQLVALLENGRASSTLEDMMSAVLNEPLSAKMQIENIPHETPLLIFRQSRSNSPGSLECVTFEEYRELKVREAELMFPEWWGVPLPVLRVFEEMVLLNDSARELIPRDAQALTDQIDRIKRERIIVLKSDGQDKTFSLHHLTEGDFLMEDISGDFEMAEDLIWWASVGKALFRRMEENGLLMKRLTPLEDPPEGAAEVIPCSWEGELMGSLAIRLPDEAEEETGREAPPHEDIAPAGSSEGEREDEPAERPLPDAACDFAGDLAPPRASHELPEGLDRVNKNAARRAYGGAPRRNAKEPEATGNAEGD